MTSETQLIQAIKSGDQAAYKQLVTQHQDYVYSVCMSVLKNRDEALEAAQDTFVKVFRSISKFDHKAKLTSWIYTIAYRTCLDYIRKRKKTVDLENANHSISALDQSGELNLEKKELHKLLEQAIDKLKVDDAGLIRLFYFKEMSLKEIVEITGLSESNVKVRIFRARKVLAEIIEKDFGDIQNFR